MALQLAAIALLLTPLGLLALVSLHAPNSVPAAGDLIPDVIGFASWYEVFKQVPMLQGLWNSTLISSLAAPLAVLMAALGGFGLSRMGRSGQMFVLLLMLLAASVPYSSIWLPRFLLLNYLGLGDTWWPMWLPALMGGSPLLVLLYWFSMRQLPASQIDAARLEGLNWLQIWWRVVMPQLRTLHWAVAALAALWTWANWLDPILYLQSPQDQTATQMLDALMLLGEGQWPVLMAAALILCLPLLLFLLLALGGLLIRRASLSPSPLLVLLLATALTGCEDSKAVTTLRLQAVADPVEAKAYQQLIDSFEAQNPDIHVEFLPVGRHAEHVTRLVTAYAGGAGPDLFLINFRRWGQFIKHDLLEPVGPLLRAQQFDPQDYFEPSLEAFQWQGELMCMPQNLSSLVVYWNRRLFAEAGVEPPQAGWDWRAFHNAAVALTRDLNGDRKPEIYGLDLDPSIVRLAPFIWQAGGRLVDDPNQPSYFGLRERESVIGLMFLKRLMNERRVMPGLPERRASSVNARFLRGEVAMTLNSRRFAASLRAHPELDWDVAPLPQHKQAATVLHADAYCLGRTSRAKPAAIRFIQFATSEAGQRQLARSGRIVPVNKAAAHSVDFLDPSLPPANAQVFLDAVEQMRRTPNIPNWYEIEMRINPLIEEWMFEPPMAGKAEELPGLRGGYRMALMIERSAGELLLP